MKFQFFRLYLLLILSATIVIWSFNELYEFLQLDTPSYQINIESITERAEQGLDTPTTTTIKASALSLPQPLRERLLSGEVIALSLTDNSRYYYRLNPKTGDITSFGPVNPDDRHEQSTSFIIPLLYGSLALVVLLLIKPIFRDLSQLQTSALSFGSNPRKMKNSISSHSAIYPLASVFHRVTAQIVDFLQVHKELSNTISHEVRTPLARMRFVIEIIKDDIPDIYKDRLNADIDEIEQLARNYLSFARLEHKEQQLNKTRLNPEVLTQELAEKFDLYQHKVAITFQSSGAKASMDEALISIASQNLIMNALRFAKKRIIFDFSCTEDCCTITVEDDGPGFGNKGEELFLAFARDQKQSNNSGYGLGLYIVRKVAIWHQGTLHLERSKTLKGASLSISWKNNLEV